MNSIPETITAEWLTVHDACKEQQALFEKTWPDGAHVTKTSLVQAAKVGLNLQWFAERVLPRSLYADYRAKHDAMNADYRAKCDALYADYQAKRDALDADYQAKYDALLIEIIWAARTAEGQAN